MKQMALPIKLQSKLSKTELHSSIIFVLHNFCDINIYGYNKMRDEYWGKTITDKRKCSLHFRVKILPISGPDLVIEIRFICGNKIVIDQLCQIFEININI